jgi:hypothetical protein
MNRIKKWEAWGAILTVIFGSLLHFVYNWSGQSKIVALFGAVNESSWEHLKLAFWPTLIFAIIEYFVFAKSTKNFFLANMVKLFSAPIIILALFYGWIAIFRDNFIYDISIFIVAVVLSYIFSYKILKIDTSLGWEKISVVLIIIGIIKFSLFTFFPPKLFLFHDPVSGVYGLHEDILKK